jgi:hypothetical protein
MVNVGNPQVWKKSCLTGADPVADVPESSQHV